MDISRRRFIANTLGLAGVGAIGGSVVGDQLAMAAALKDRYFIFCYFPAAWDVLLTLDPRDPEVFRDDRKKETRIEPGYHLMPEGFQDLVQGPNGTIWGPYIGDFANIADRATVVRGLSMDTLTHEVGRRRFITGKPPSGLQARGSSVATMLAAQYGTDRPIPNLASGHETYNVDMERSATGVSVGSVNDLVRALKPVEGGPAPLERRQIQEMLDTFRACEANEISPALASAYGFQSSARELVGAGLWSSFDFTSDRPEMRAIRDFYRIPNGDMRSPEARAAMAVTAITSDISRCVSISASVSLDTHADEWLDEQGPRQMAGLDIVARIVRDLESRPYRDTDETWLDRTVIVGYSDFSRTPLLNGRSGRDHWLGNSCFLIGAGIKKGAVIGASSDIGMAPQSMDLTTGELDPSGEVVKPEHILRALCVDMGLDDDRVTDLRVEPFTAVLEG